MPRLSLVVMSTATRDRPGPVAAVLTELAGSRVERVKDPGPARPRSSVLPPEVARPRRLLRAVARGWNGQ
jgi:hypothetical protein